ncbi:tripartite tricarboxylate transporter substrate binding protein [Bordetella sp. H567]|uniref:tripartite tricarboxylate transporter substrate binding protein n=1 Tax=Bordetella sp. H567 TaxID=1697043 RepID=UPI00082C2F6B|nr:tripartite tricarboxylate transporter substrate binding protein [Bordetella sp. H567]
MASFHGIGRRMAWTLAAGVALAAATAHAQAQDNWPSRPIRLVVPFAAGGSLDVVARTMAQRLGQALGVSVVVDNRGGANGIIGTDMVAKAAPDGYTMLMNTGSFTANGVLYKKLPYRPMEDFVPVTQIARSYGLVMAVNPDVPARTVKDFIALAKAHPESMNFSSSGEGNITHLAGALFNHLAGTHIQHVAYRGSGQAFQAVIARQITMNFVSTSGGLPAIQAGQLRALAITSTLRAPVLPEVPTFNEVGMPGMSKIQGWYGLWLPAGTPKAIVDRVQREVARFLPDPEVRKRFEDMGLITMGTTPQAFQGFLEQDIQDQRELMKLANVAQQ